MNTKGTLRIASLAAVALLAACQDSTSPGVTAPDLQPALERSERAQEVLQAKFGLASAEVLDLPGTVYADHDERIGKLVFAVEHIGFARAVQNRLQQIGVAEDEYELRLSPAIHAVATLRDRFRPTVAGIQINFTQYVCTLGFNVSHAGGRSFITNSHCTANQGGNDNTAYWQPVNAAGSTEVIAREVDDPPFVRNLTSTCSKGKRCRWSDAARALYDAGTASTQGQIAQTTGVNNQSLTVSSTSSTFSIVAQNTSSTSFSGVMNKVGRTTGWTAGNVSQTCVNVNVSGTSNQLLCQTMVQGSGTIVSGGDSGSPVFTASGNNATLVGILWGGSSDNRLFVFSPLNNIVRELGSFTATQ